jgi:hypothetical protein
MKSHLIKKNKLIELLFSVIFGFFGAITFIIRWPYFFRRSLFVQVIVLFLLVGFLTLIFFTIWKKINPYVHTLGITKLISISVLSVSISFLLIIIFSLTVSIPPLPVGQHKLEISMINSENMDEVIQQLRIIEIRIDDRVIPFTSCQISGNWMNSENSLLLGESGKLDCIFSIRMDSVVKILLEKDPKAGIISIKYDDHLPIVIDLFSDRTDQIIQSFSNIPSVVFSLLYCCEISFISWFVFLAIIYTPSKTKLSFLGRINITERMYILSFFLFFTLVYSQIQMNIGFQKIIGGWNYFTGNQGAISAYGPVESYGINTGARNDINTCFEIERLVPGDNKVLILNGFGAVEPCLFSPLLPRDKIVHHYETVATTGPYFHDLMYGEPEVAYSLYRRLGINYFYLRKEDSFFSPFGYSNALKPGKLRNHFEIFGETKDFYILTWPGKGKYPISDLLSNEINNWYKDSKDQEKSPNNIWWRGKMSLDKWNNQIDKNQ